MTPAMSGMILRPMRVAGPGLLGSYLRPLRWLADYAGVPLDNRLLSATERADWARQQRLIKRELPRARLWQRAALALGDQVLDNLKAALADPKLPRPEI